MARRLLSDEMEKHVDESTRSLNRVSEVWYPHGGEYEDVTPCSLQCWSLKGDVY